MLKCLFIRRRLYEYLDNALSDIEGIKVKEHLSVCQKCRERLRQIQNLLDLASQRKALQPGAEFWHNFKTDLDRKLNERLVPGISVKGKLSYQTRPVFVYAVIAIFILAASTYLYKDYLSVQQANAQDESLASEIAALDEIGETVELDHDEDSYIEEINLLYQADQNLT